MSNGEKMPQSLMDRLFWAISVDLYNDTLVPVAKGGACQQFYNLLSGIDTYSAFLEIYLRDFVLEQYRESFQDVLAPENILSSIREGRLCSVSYAMRTTYGNQRRMTITAFSADGDPSSGKCTITASSIDSDYNILTRLEEEEERHQLVQSKTNAQNIVLQSLGAMFSSIGLFDLLNNSFQEVISRTGVHPVIQDVEDAQDALNICTDVFVSDSDRPSVRAFFDLGTLAARLKNQRSVSVEFYGSEKNWTRASFLPVKEADGVVTAVLLVTQVINEEKNATLQYQAALKSALSDAVKANEAKSRFLNNVSHDIRTPINGIKGMMHIMKAEAGNEELVKASIETTEKLSRQLEMLVNDVLEMSRIESGKFELAREGFSLPDKLSELFPAISSMAESRGVVLAGSHFDIQHEHIVSSPLHVQRIMMNILSNAVKYNRTGGTIECWMRETAIDDSHSNYTCIIKDSGIGMSEEFVKKVFEPFEREENQLATEAQSTGLGMSITKELVDMLGGTIEIESQLGVGTSVIINLPFEICEDVLVEEDRHAQASLKGVKVLLVEDNEVNLEIAKFILEEQEALVDVARNGQEALEAIESSSVGSYAMVLMDIRMPVMNGYEATREIRRLDRVDAKALPIIAMTANAFEEDIKQCLATGMNDHIAKPIDVDVMMAKIARYL